MPLLGSGAVFEEVELANLVEFLRVVGEDIVHTTHGPINTRTWSKLRGIDFGIDHPFAAILLAWDRDYDVIDVLAELKLKGAVPAIHASRMKAIAANAPVAWPHDGTQRDKGSGEQLATIYRKEGLAMLPMDATFPAGGYSTEAGVMEVLTRMRDARFKVSAGCREWGEEFEGYHRKNGLVVKANDDLPSATRVGVMQLRSAKPVPLGSRRKDVLRPRLPRE